MGARIQEAGCWAHARRKFFELHAANKSQIAQQALMQIGQIYNIEREWEDASDTERLVARQQQIQPVIERLHVWLIEHRSKVPDGSATAKAIDYSHQTMAGADAFPERRANPRGQQLSGEPDSSGRLGP